MPLISIITPMYNGADFIEECLTSVQAQTLGDYEHFVIDNMSTDGGADIVKRLAENDPRIKLLSNDKFKGAASTRNVGIKEATGKYIAFLDADDAWKPEKLAVQIGEMKARDLAFSWASYDVVDENGTYQRTQEARDGSSQSLMMKETVIGCLTAVYDQEQLGKIKMTYTAMPEDFCLWMDILREVEKKDLRAAAIENSLARYRVHLNGVSAGKAKAAKAHWGALRNHLGLPLIPASIAFASYAVHALKARA
jgi:glycosyltransferase involved in cell wall biosynthesis